MAKPGVSNLLSSEGYFYKIKMAKSSCNIYSDYLWWLISTVLRFEVVNCLMFVLFLLKKPKGVMYAARFLCGEAVLMVSSLLRWSCTIEHKVAWACV